MLFLSNLLPIFLYPLGLTLLLLTVTGVAAASRYRRLKILAFATAIGQFIPCFAPEECENYFAAAGYDAT